MLIYWFLFIVTVILTSIVVDLKTRRVYLCLGSLEQYPASICKMMFIFLPTIFFLGMRSRVGDTINYYEGFKVLSSEFNLIGLDDRAYGYSILQRFCKAYLFSDPNAWLIFLVLLSMIPIAINLSKYSTNVRISAFVFFASTEFTFLINGARQFLAVCICFYAFNFLVENKPIRYFLVIALACTIHITAIVMLPMYFIVKCKPWSVRMWIVIIVAVLSCTFSERLFGSFNDYILSDTVYSHYAADVLSMSGIKWQRVMVAFVPVLLSFYGKNEIGELNNKAINYCVNFSVLSALFYLFASTIGGNLTARVAEYFNIFNLILYPCLFTNILKNQECKNFKFAFVFFYILFFVYQMHIAWEGLPYVSEALGIYC